MTDEQDGGWVERAGRRAGLATPLTQQAAFIFVFAASGFLAALTGAVLSVTLEDRPDWETVLTLLAQAVLCAASFGLLRWGRSFLAAWTLMLTALGCATVLLFTGTNTGFDDIAVMLFAVLAIAASVLFDSVNFVISQILVVAVLGFVLAVELQGAGAGGRGSLVADGGFALLIVVVSGLGTQFLAAGLRRSTAERQRQEQHLREANLELESRAVEREGLIRELEMRNSELERFAYTISHELKSPLVTIGGFLPLFRKSAEAGDRESMDRAFDRISVAHTRMGRLLSELLDLCRMGYLHNPAETFSLVDVIDEAREAALTFLSETGLRVEIADDLPALRGDRRRMVEVFQNLLENAARFTRGRPDPRVEIGVRREANGSVVFVRDNGVGIDPSFHDAVFDLFYKLNPGDPGTGIGLAIARRIIELHDGEIWVESAGLGHGATLCISLPWLPDTSVVQSLPG